MRGTQCERDSFSRKVSKGAGCHTWKADLVLVPNETLPSMTSAPPKAFRILAVPVCASPPKWREGEIQQFVSSLRLTFLRTHGSAFSVTDIRRSPEEVFRRLLDAEDNVDIFAFCERAVAPLERGVDAAVNVERLERFGELPCCLEEGAEGLLRRSGSRRRRRGGGKRVERGREEGRGRQRGEVRSKDAREESGSCRVSSEDPDRVQAERRVEVVVDLLAKKIGSVLASPPGGPPTYNLCEVFPCSLVLPAEFALYAVLMPAFGCGSFRVVEDEFDDGDGDLSAGRDRFGGRTRRR